MRRIKDDAPVVWNSFIKKNPHIQYNQLDDTDKGKKVRSAIKEHMIAQQKYLCCYCCKQIDSGHSHNEHIKPKERYPRLSMDYENLLVSCTSTSCGMAKAAEYDDTLFISPLDEDCEKHFRYEEDGYIVGKTKKGEYTISLLQLNAYGLVDSRKNLYKECCEMAKYCGIEYIQSEYMQEHEGVLPRFCDMVSYFFREGYFAPEVLA